eukprot:TRINITY_DN36753_c0_g1_i1.p1 TRINITY_DN36753_c0_g1~~TRINITY_DN36753_c0_g1_i1.p1  ORF type:complete len:518 (+),score=93.16 TRINITY_DN36753_c0_g1_i1:136-1689(+)
MAEGVAAGLPVPAWAMALSDARSRSMARAFLQSTGPDGFVSAADGRALLQETGLPLEHLRRIWELSDLDRDFRLSLREFVCAMQLVGLLKAGRALPLEVHPREQEDVVTYIRPFVDNAVSSSQEERGKDVSLNGVRAAGTLGDMPATVAPIFEKAALLDSTDDLRRLSSALVDERSGLSHVLARRRDMEGRLRDVHRSMDKLREERRSLESEMAANESHVLHLQRSIQSISEEVTANEQERSMLRHTGALQANGSAERRGPAPYASPEEERRDVLAKVRAERELLQRDQRGIHDSRHRLVDASTGKRDAEAMQQHWFERRQQAEQDRGLMMTALETERSKLTALRAERLLLCEERSALESELADLAQERWLAEQETERLPYARTEEVIQGRPQSDRAEQRLSANKGVLREEWQYPPHAVTVLDGWLPMPAHPGSGAAPEHSNNVSWMRRPEAGQARSVSTGRLDKRGVRNDDLAAGAAVVGSSAAHGGGWDDTFGGPGTSLPGSSVLGSQRMARFGG